MIAKPRSRQACVGPEGLAGSGGNADLDRHMLLTSKNKQNSENAMLTAQCYCYLIVKRGYLK